jgi:hypothetical protein
MIPGFIISRDVAVLLKADQIENRIRSVYFIYRLRHSIVYGRTIFASQKKNFAKAIVSTSL